MKTKLITGLSILLMFISCSDNEELTLEKWKYRVELEIIGEPGTETIGLFTFNILKNNGKEIDNKTNIQIHDKINGKIEKLTSFYSMHLAPGMYSFETTQKVENILIIGSITSNEIESKSFIKATVFKNDKIIHTESLSANEPIKQFVYNTY